ncbi:MAG: hypothetical protein ACR2GQ_09525 [Gemmatimonadota bacterium]
MDPSSSGGARERRAAVAYAGALAGAVLLLFYPVILGGESFFGRDMTPFFYPMKQYLAEALRAGRFPLWNPLTAGGEPFFATLQPGVLYPGSLPLLVLPFPVSVDWIVVLHFLFAGWGWLLVLRHEGRTPSAAVLGALAFMLGGFFVSLGNFLNNLQTAAWAPWLLLTWSLYRRDRSGSRLVLFSASCTAAFLGGEPQLLGLILAVVFAHGLLRESGAARNGGLAGSGLRQALAFGAAGILAVLAAGVQMVPFVEFVGQSVRTLPLDLGFAAPRSQDPAGLLHIVLPPALGAGDLGFSTRFMAHARVPWILSLYPGVLVGVFWARGFGAVPRREGWFWGALAVLGLVLALGAHTPIYRSFFELLPPLRTLRYPEKFAVLASLGFPFLAAAGFDRWREEPSNRAPARALAWIGGIYLVVGVALLWRPSLPSILCGGDGGPLLCGEAVEAGRLYGATAFRLAALALAAGAALAWCGRGGLRPARVAWIVVALAVLDLAVAHRPVNPSVERSIYTSTPWAADVLGQRLDRRDEYRYRGTPVTAAMGEAARVTGAADLSNTYLNLQALGPNAAQSFGFLQQDGLQGVELQSVAMTHDAAIHRWGSPLRYLQLMNVRFYADPTALADSIPALREIARNPELPIRLFEVPDPLPRAFLADGWEVADGPGRALERALGENLPIRRVVLEGVGAAPPRASARGRIVAATWEAERVRLVTRSREPGVLVLLDRWYPGWRVYVDRQLATLLRANGVFRAVEIPAGEADVEFVFAPRSLRTGAWMTCLGIAGWILLLWRSRRRAAA